MSRPFVLRTTLEGAMPTASAPVAMLGDIPLRWGVGRSTPYGTDTGEANALAVHEYTIATGATTSVDLTAFPSTGTVVAISDLDLVFTAVESLIIESDPENTTDVTIAPNETNGLAELLGASGSRVIRPGGYVVFADKMTIDSTHKVVDITNASGASATVRVTVVGISGSLS